MAHSELSPATGCSADGSFGGRDSGLSVLGWRRSGSDGDSCSGVAFIRSCRRSTARMRPVIGRTCSGRRVRPPTAGARGSSEVWPPMAWAEQCWRFSHARASKSCSGGLPSGVGRLRRPSQGRQSALAGGFEVVDRSGEADAGRRCARTRPGRAPSRRRPGEVWPLVGDVLEIPRSGPAQPRRRRRRLARALPVDGPRLNHGY